MHDQIEVLTEREAAKFLRVSVSALRQGRSNGPRAGHAPIPPYVKYGRSIKYLKNDLKEFLERFRVDSEGGNEV
jgi:hypothetical protein